jgi:hypothetical protein
MSDEFFGTRSSDLARHIYEQIDVPDAGLTLGPYNTYGLLDDPKRFAFMLSRHKFVAKMLDGYGRVLEIGCQEGIGSLVVSKSVKRLTAIDFFRRHIEVCQRNFSGLLQNVAFVGHDILDGPVGEGEFDGAFSLDVLEHIDPAQEDLYMMNVCRSLGARGTFLCGIPSLESQVHASAKSKQGHVNCKTGPAMKAFCQRFFHHVFMFGMNDEVVHTGFFPMCQYIIAMCVDPKVG